MRNLILSLIIFPSYAFSHGIHEEVKSATAVSGSSIYQFDSTWIDQKKRTLKLPELQGKPRLVAMLFTKCETACPLIVQDVKAIAKELEAHRAGAVGVTLFSLDAIRETPETLAAFAEKRKLPSEWILVKSNAGAVAELAAALGVRYKRLGNGDFIHSNTIYFLNAKGEVTTQKDGLNTPSAQFLKTIKDKL